MLILVLPDKEAAVQSGLKVGLVLIGGLLPLFHVKRRSGLGGYLLIQVIVDLIPMDSMRLWIFFKWTLGIGKDWALRTGAR